MQTLQIRLPEGLISKIDSLIETGLFRSRSEVLRIALDKYVSELNFIGTLPYIVGPFTPEQIEILKKPPATPLEVPESEMVEIRKLIANLKV